LYRCIVLAYDGSREGRTALREGALLALSLGAKIFLLCVLAEGPGSQVGDAVHQRELPSPGHRALFDEAMDRLQRLGLEAVGRIQVGEPTLLIGAYAREVGADLVVVGHRKQSLLSRWWSGANGAYLVDNVPCSVLIGRLNVAEDAFMVPVEAAAS
jgi:nucleotide-binding universal stress UspA family protein